MSPLPPSTPGYHMNFTDIQGDIHSNTHKTIFAKGRTFQPNHPYFSPPHFPLHPSIFYEKKKQANFKKKTIFRQ